MWQKKADFILLNLLFGIREIKLWGNIICHNLNIFCFSEKVEERKLINAELPTFLEIPNKKTKGEDGKNIHDTEKPVELMKVLIENSSNIDEVVFEPFMGVGSTIMACIELDRKYIGCEIDEKYYNIAKNRIENTINSVSNE